MSYPPLVSGCIAAVRWLVLGRVGGTDRAQLTTPRWMPLLLTGGAVVAVVVAELRAELAAAPFDEVESVCGLCGVDWTPVASLLIIGALVLIAAHVVSFVKWPPEDSDE